MADNLLTSCADVTESGSLNLPEPYGPHRAVMGMLSLFFTHFYVYCEKLPAHIKIYTITMQVLIKAEEFLT
jgi:hypothetical protein